MQGTETKHHVLTTTISGFYFYVLENLLAILLLSFIGAANSLFSVTVVIAYTVIARDTKLGTRFLNNSSVLITTWAKNKIGPTRTSGGYSSAHPPV